MQPTGTDSPPAETQNQQYVEYKYKWVIVALMSLGYLITSLANNTVVPIAYKLAQVYGLSDTKVYMPVFTSYIVYSLMNFPANHLIDQKGLRFSLILGAIFYSVGFLFFAMVNISEHFFIIGAATYALGQPFIINCPSKVAANWFKQQNRTVATAIMIGISIILTGLGFIIPPMIVRQQSGDTEAMMEVGKLYFGYMVIAIFVLIMQVLFMRSSPPTPASKASEKPKMHIIQSFKLIKSNPNLIKFNLSYILIYGTFLTISVTSNQLLKPYGYQDIHISGLGVTMIFSGVAGGVYFSNQIKKTKNYQSITRKLLIAANILLFFYSLWLNTYAQIFGTVLIAVLLGFTFVPMVPISYDLGCELSFPVGEAQVIGILNGGSMIFTFLMILILSELVGFGTKQQSFILFTIFNIVILCGSFIYWSLKMDLQRTQYQNSKIEITLQSHDTIFQNSKPIQEQSTQSETKQGEDRG